MAAAIFGHVAMAYVRLQEDPREISTRDEYMRTSLWWASQRGHPKVVKVLLDTLLNHTNQQKQEYDQQIKAALHVAAIKGHTSVIEIMHQFNIDLFQ